MSLKLLIVHPNEAIRHQVMLQAGRVGARVMLASDFAGAQMLLGPGIDAVLLDPSLTDILGTCVVTEALSAAPRARVGILLSATRLVPLDQAMARTAADDLDVTEWLISLAGGRGTGDPTYSATG